MEKLTIQEEEVMLHIWSMGEMCIRDRLWIIDSTTNAPAAPGAYHAEVPSNLVKVRCV